MRPECGSVVPTGWEVPGQGHPPRAPDVPDGQQQLAVPGNEGQDPGRETHCSGTPGRAPWGPARPTPTRGTGSVLNFSCVSSPWGVSERAPSPWAVAPTVLSQPPGSLGPLPAAGEAQTASTVTQRDRLPGPPCRRGLRGSAGTRHGQAAPPTVPLMPRVGEKGISVEDVTATEEQVLISRPVLSNLNP